MITTPHLGASTQEAQEGVAIEVVEAVVEALAGKLSANAVNAPMVAPEVLKELQPYVTLAEGLGKVRRARRDAGGGCRGLGCAGGWGVPGDARVCACVCVCVCVCVLTWCVCAHACVSNEVGM